MCEPQRKVRLYLARNNYETESYIVQEEQMHTYLFYVLYKNEQES